MGVGDIYYTAAHIELGLPPPEKWRGMELAKTVGRKGYTVDTFLEDSRKSIGFETWHGVEPPNTKLGNPIDAFTITEFSYGQGDDNPLYTNPDYAKNTKYGCLIAPPTIVMLVKYPVNRGVTDWGPYPVSNLPSAADWTFYDVIRANDRYRSSMKLDEVFEKKGRTGRLCFTTVDLSVWNQSDCLTATGEAICISVGRAAGGMLYERPTYHYSKEEIEKIVAGIAGEERRGAEPRYWEDVKIGDKLTPIVKGPYVFMDFITEQLGDHRTFPSFELNAVGRYSNFDYNRKNEVTGWPFEKRNFEHYDFNLSKQRGLPGPFDIGMARIEKSEHLLSNWMGDDGFIRRLYSSIRKPHYYGDTLWLSGEVVKKYKDKVADIEYAAVDIEIYGRNQVGEDCLPGKATIYLPSREIGEVVLPIPAPPEEEWKLITKRNAQDFVREIESGETLFPFLPVEMEGYYEWLARQE